MGQQREHTQLTTQQRQHKLGTYGSRLACHGTRTERWTCRSLRPYCTLFRAQLDSPCPFTLAARPNTIIRDLGRGCSDGCCHIPRLTVGCGQRCSERRPSGCVYATTTTHTHTHTYTRRAWRPWITLGRGAALVWAGLACRARGDKEKRQKMKPVQLSSHRRLFWPSILQLRVVRLPSG